MPMIVTPMKTTSAIAKVTMMWLVTVKPCRPTMPNGSRPSALQNRMNMNSVKMKGK